MLRVATFNLNNLFDRFNFHALIPESPRVRATYRWRLDAARDLLPPLDDDPGLDPEGAEFVEGMGPVRIEFSPQGRVVKPKRSEHLTALLDRTDRLDADVLAVQEVENLAALREFNSMLDAPYRFVSLLEGNDPRFIDVGLLSKLPIGSATSNRWVPDPDRPAEFLFSRDLMAVEILNADRDDLLFTIWVAHLKSKFVDPAITDEDEIEEANEKNDKRRKRQAKGAHDIIEAYHAELDDERFVVCGDFNDHPGSDPLEPLLDGDLGIHDVFEGGVDVEFERPEGEGPRISNPEDTPDDENWTHRLTQSNAPDKFERLDHLLVSRSLRDLQRDAKIQRRTHWGKNQAGTDHDPVFVDLDLEA